MQVKIFSGNTDMVEAEINLWLERTKPSRIVQMTQSEFDNGEWQMTITLLYEPSLAEGT